MIVSVLRKSLLSATLFICLALLPFSCGRKAKPNQEPARVSAEFLNRPDTSKDITIIFGGDVMQHMPQVAAARRGDTYDYSETFRYLKPVFGSADLVIVNLETTISKTGHYTGYPMFSSPVQLVSALKESGVDVVMLANNHILDKGKTGVHSTIEVLDSIGIKHTGIFTDSSRYHNDNPLYVKIKGANIAILNYNYGFNGMPVPRGIITNPLDTVRMAADLEKINRDTVHYVVAYLHWGAEYSRKPDREQKAIAEWCEKNNITFIIGSHPHVIQPVESIGTADGRTTSITAYSLGNLVSNQRERYTDGGLLLKVEADYNHASGAQLNKATKIPVWVQIPYENGRRKYIILPPSVADTLLIEGSADYTAYRRFITDTGTLLEQ